MPQRTYSAKPADIRRQWHVVDAGGQGLAVILEGVLRYARGYTVEMTRREQTEEASEARRGRVEIVWHESRLLQSNPLGDPARRELGIYLPPSYDRASSRRFPAVLFLWPL